MRSFHRHYRLPCDIPSFHARMDAKQSFISEHSQLSPLLAPPCTAQPRSFDLCSAAGDDEEDSSTVLIRGFEAAKCHKDAAQPTMQELRRGGVIARIIGGGTIRHYAVSESIFIYGCVFVVFPSAPPARVQAPLI